MKNPPLGMLHLRWVLNCIINCNVCLIGCSHIQTHGFIACWCSNEYFIPLHAFSIDKIILNYHCLTRDIGFFLHRPPRSC